MICKNCGKPFTPTHHKQTYCSPTCVQQARKNNYQRYIKKHHKKIKAKCEYCGKPFTKNKEHRRYCSTQCAKYARLEHKADYQKTRRKQINNKELISNENEYIGTSYLSQHRRKNFNEEHAKIQKEMRRLKLKQ